MGDERSTEAGYLAEIGFAHSATAERDLSALAPHYPPSAIAALVTRCAASVDPDSALAAMSRVVTQRARDGLDPPPERTFDAIVSLGAASEFLPRLLAGRPALAEWLAGSRFLDRTPPDGLLAKKVGAQVTRLAPADVTGFDRVLRRFRYREIARIAYRDLTGRAPFSEVGRELSNLAAACVETAIAFHDRALHELHGAPEGGRSRCAALGFGKLGGRDLNFSSDIDLIFAYDGDGISAGGSAGPLPHRDYYARLVERVTASLSSVTPEGFVFRVDLALRPHGRNGPIVNSLAELLLYYEAQGRTWERAAWLRARPIAGDPEVGELAIQRLLPFVYRAVTDVSAAAEMQAMKREIDRQVRSHGGNVKLGRGGIREIEFFVQSLQLLYGGRDERVRDENTLEALDKTLVSGRVNARDHDLLAAAYVFLRRVENRIQMWAERQTHVLPESMDARRRIAKSVGLPDAAALEAELDRHRRGVSELFSDILVASGEEPPKIAADLAMAVDSQLPDAQRVRALDALGFSDPHAAVVSLAGLARREGSPFRGYGVTDPRAAHLLSEIAATPDPDRALFHLSDFFGALNAPAPYFELLARNAHLARLLVGLFGTSDFLSRYLLRHPELLESLVRGDATAVHKPPAALAKDLANRLRGCTAFEDRIGAICRFKNEEVLRIGLNDVAGSLDLVEVTHELADVADVVLESVLAEALAEATERYGAPQAGSLVVLGLGKLGGRELGYQSDLDLIFVYGSPGETRGGRRGVVSHQEFFATVAQKLTAAIHIPVREGSLYRVDTRLRPSGNQGMLVVVADSFAIHQRERAQLWERQAMLKVRRVAGDAGLWARIEAKALRPAFERPLDPAQAAVEIRQMRRRIEEESSRESADHYDPKYGPGGLVDVEFAVQYLQLCHVAKHPELRQPSTLAALDALASAGLIDRDSAAVLAEAYRFLRRLEQRLHIVHDFAEGAMPRRGRTLDHLARRLGYQTTSAGDQLLADYQSWTWRVRDVFDQITHA